MRLCDEHERHVFTEVEQSSSVVEICVLSYDIDMSAFGLDLFVVPLILQTDICVLAVLLL